MKKKVKKLILQDFATVIELIKYAHKNKQKIDVKRMGNGYVGIYWKVTLL